MTTDQAYKAHKKATADLLTTLSEGDAKLMREYYRSKSRPLDELSKQRVLGVAASIREVMLPRNGQQRYQPHEQALRAENWIKKLETAFDREIPKEN
jgi:hypothetical protein